MTDMIIRFIGWLIFYILTLGIVSVKVTYTNGMKIKFIGWPEAFINWQKRRKSEQR